jgi:hypothetical protein
METARIPQVFVTPKPDALLGVIDVDVECNDDKYDTKYAKSIDNVLREREASLCCLFSILP